MKREEGKRCGSCKNSKPVHLKGRIKECVEMKKMVSCQSKACDQYIEKEITPTGFYYYE